MLNDGSQVLLSVEAEAYLEAFEKFSVKDIGNIRFVTMVINTPNDKINK